MDPAAVVLESNVSSSEPLDAWSRGLAEWTLTGLGLVTAGLNGVLVVCLLRRVQRTPGFTAAWPLVGMSVCDSLALLGPMLSAAIGNHRTEGSSELLLELSCQWLPFVCHVASGTSLWAYVLLATLTLTAVARPHSFRRKSHPLRRCPKTILLGALLAMMLLESWIPLSVTYDRVSGFCREATLITPREGSVMLLLDLVLAYLVPCGLASGMSLAVFVRLSRKAGGKAGPSERGSGAQGTAQVTTSGYHLSPLTSTARPSLVSVTSTGGQRRAESGTKKLHRFLLLTLVDLFLNLPFQTLRLWNNLFQLGFVAAGTGKYANLITYLMYHSQFSVKAVLIAKLLYSH